MVTASTWIVRVVGILGASVLVVACKPEFSERSSLVTGLRVLAIQSEPAEAAPRASTPAIQYAALVVDETGSRDAELDWAFCTEPRPVSELNDVSQACFLRRADWILPMSGAGLVATGSLPTNGCRQFGPNPPEARDGGALGRPSDPDSTGGYYQPVRVLSNSEAGVEAVGQTRLHCDLAGATSDILREYSFRYRNNTNPIVEELVAVGGVDETLLPDAPSVPPFAVASGATVHLRASWAACDANVPCPPDATDFCPEPDPCTGAESYVLFDLPSRSVAERREAIRVSWFATAGSFANDNTGRAAEEYQLLSTDNDWTAPVSGDAFVWVVLRDSRGGVSWTSYRVSVQ
jgi:hypothetical protein